MRKLIKLKHVTCNLFLIIYNLQISTCNGRHCGDTFPGPNGPTKPSLWTENWTAQ